MLRLVYVSSATREMTEDDLDRILSKARERNESKQITGMLLYGGGNFIQILEGEEENVREIYELIVKDPRHTNALEIVTEQVEQRLFPEWTMGYRRLRSQDQPKLKGYTDFLNTDMKPEEIAQHPDAILDLLSMFRKDNY